MSRRTLGKAQENHGTSTYIENLQPTADVRDVLVGRCSLSGGRLRTQEPSCHFMSGTGNPGVPSWDLAWPCVSALAIRLAEYKGGAQDTDFKGFTEGHVTNLLENFGAKRLKFIV